MAFIQNTLHYNKSALLWYNPQHACILNKCTKQLVISLPGIPWICSYAKVGHKLTIVLTQVYPRSSPGEHAAVVFEWKQGCGDMNYL